jgi:nitrous oxidase accessory protein
MGPTRASKLILGLWIMLGIVPAVFGGEIVVGPSKPIQTLRDALKVSKPGDTIRLQRGVYKEGNLVIDKPVAIVGEDLPELDGEGKVEVLTIVSDGVVIEGLLIRNSGVSFLEDQAAIRLEGVRSCAVKNCRLYDNFFGIYLAKSSDCLIENNLIEGSALMESYAGNAIHLWSCTRIRIEGNKIRGHRDGIYFEFVKDGWIKGNLSEKNLRYGLHFMFSDSCRYLENTFRENGAGVAVMYTKNVSMQRNTFIHNWGPGSFGLLLKDIDDSQIEENVFNNNTVGIYAEGSNRVKVMANAFKQNGFALRIMANCEGSVFEGNAFLGNAFDVTTNSTQNPNRFTRNYWDAYKGYDLNKDGLGDVPFRPVSLLGLVVERVPPALILLKSPLSQVLDTIERAIPTLIPETLKDETPLMANPL